MAAMLSAVMLQSCFQDMNHPDFDYPDSSAPKVYSPMKINLPFDDDIRDKGNYGFLVRNDGNSSFTEGVNGKAYQGAAKAYVLATTPAYLKDTIPDLGSFTVAFWMKSKKNTSAEGLFSLSNTVAFWGNLDIMLENNNSDSDTEAFFKIHLLNEVSGTTSEQWVTAKVANVFGTNWVHMAFCYDEKTSTASIYKDGQKVHTQVLANYGKLKFKNAGAIVIGGFQFSTNPSLTTGATDQEWASTYKGQMDQFHFYNKAISETEIQRLVSEKL